MKIIEDNKPYGLALTIITDDTHYQLQFYGGKLIEKLSFEPTMEAFEQSVINLRERLKKQLTNGKD